MERTEATAEASFAAERERRRLGMAMAATIRITDTTTNNSIREKPICFERIVMNSSKPIDRLPRPPPINQAVLVPMRLDLQNLTGGICDIVHVSAAKCGVF